MTHGVRRRDGATYDFETGLAISGVDLGGPDGPKAIGLQLPGEVDLRTLYDWMVDTKARLNSAQQAVPFATNASAIEGLAMTELISPSNLKAVVDNVVGPAPTAINTFTEFVAAINSDPHYASTVFAEFALKAPLASPAFTGPVTSVTPANAGNPKQVVTIGFLEAMITDLLLGLKPAPALPVLTGATYAVVGSTYALSMSSVPSDPALHIATFEVSVNGAAPVVIAAANDSAVYNWSVDVAAGQSVTFTVLAKDTKNKYSSAAVMQTNVIAELIAHPVVLAPAANAPNQSLKPLITTSAFTPIAGSDTHAYTDWTIRLVSSNQIVYQSLADAVNLTSLQVPADVLLTSREYEITVVYTGTTLGASGAGVSRFVTSFKRAAPTIITPAGWMNGSDLTFTYNGQGMVQLPETAAPTKFYVSIGDALHPVEYISAVQPATFTIAANLLSETTPGQLELFFWAIWSETGITQIEQRIIPVVVPVTPTILFPTNNAVEIAVSPSFTASAYSSNVVGDTFDHQTWTITDAAGQLVIEETVTNQAAWTPAIRLNVNTSYRVKVKQYSSVNTSGISSALTAFTTTLQGQMQYQNSAHQVFTPSVSNPVAAMMVATRQDGGQHIYGLPYYAENRNNQSGVSTAYYVGRAETYNRQTQQYSRFVDSPFTFQVDGTYPENIGISVKMSRDGNVLGATGGDNAGATIVDALVNGSWRNAMTTYAPNGFKPLALAMSGDGTAVVVLEMQQFFGVDIRTHLVSTTSAATVDIAPRQALVDLFPQGYTDPATGDVYTLFQDGSAPPKIALSDDGLRLAIGVTYRFGYQTLSMVLVRTRASVLATSWSAGVLIIGKTGRNMLLSQQNDWLTLSGDGNTLIFSGSHTANPLGFVEIYKYTNNAWSLFQVAEGQPVRIDPTNSGTLTTASTRAFGSNVCTNFTGSKIAVAFQLLNSAPKRYDILRLNTQGTSYDLMGLIIAPSYGNLALNSANDNFGYHASMSADGQWLDITDGRYTGSSGVQCGGVLSYNIGPYT